MPSSLSAESVRRTRPVRVKSVSILAMLLTPKPKMKLDGPQTAYIKPKSHSRPVRLNAVQIANECRFVQGLGYIRVDATPYRSRAAKKRGSTAPPTMEDEEVFPWPPAGSRQVGSFRATQASSSKSRGLYEEPRRPTSYIPWPTLD